MTADHLPRIRKGNRWNGPVHFVASDCPEDDSESEEIRRFWCTGRRELAWAQTECVNRGGVTVSGLSGLIWNRRHWNAHACTASRSRKHAHANHLPTAGYTRSEKQETFCCFIVPVGLDPCHNMLEAQASQHYTLSSLQQQHPSNSSVCR